MRWALNNMRLIITGGGTGGHIYPGIAIAKELMGRGVHHKVLWIGAKRGLETKLVTKEKLDFTALEVTGLKGKGAMAKAQSTVRLAKAIAQSIRMIIRFKPSVVLGVGGYASGPASVAALLTGHPLALAEQNAAPGMTNRKLARYAKALFLSWPGSERFFKKNIRSIQTGNPVKQEFFNVEANKKDERLNILVIGGSQGAGSINRAMVEAAPLLNSIANKIMVTHQTGESDIKKVRSSYQNARFEWVAEPYLYDMAQQIANADLVISRSGAGAIAEICSVGRAAIYVPFPYAADDHQTKNAEPARKANAAIVIADSELNGGWIANEIMKFEESGERLIEMGKQAKGMAKPRAAEMIVDELLALAGEAV